MQRRAEIRETSRLAADPGAVWERAMSAEGINNEMAPLFRMTVPRGLEDLDLAMVEHERTIEPLADGGCTVTDRVAWEPRLPLPGRLLRPLFGAFFRHRHRRLRRHFGGADGGGSSSG
jgi:hypothetical protein